VKAPLFDPATVPDPNITNTAFLKQYIADLLSNVQSYVALSGELVHADILLSAQINSFVSLMFDHSSDPFKFKFTLRDFLISLKEFSGDNVELYIEEREEETERKALEEREAAMRVPGILKPSQLDDDADL